MPRLNTEVNSGAVETFAHTPCGICRSTNSIVADGSCWRLPSSEDTIVTKIAKWHENRHPSSSSRSCPTVLPVCQSCLDLVTETQLLENRLEEHLKLLWHLLDGVEVSAEQDIKPEIVLEGSESGQHSADALTALLSVETNLKTEGVTERDPIAVPSNRNVANGRGTSSRPRRSKETARTLVQLAVDDCFDSGDDFCNDTDGDDLPETKSSSFMAENGDSSFEKVLIPRKRRNLRDEPWTLQEVDEHENSDESEEDEVSSENSEDGDWKADLRSDVRESRSLKQVTLPKRKSTAKFSFSVKETPSSVKERPPKKSKPSLTKKPRLERQQPRLRQRRSTVSRKDADVKDTVIDPENLGFVGGDDWLRAQCRVCDQAFLSFADLLTHFTANHDGLKPFVCHFCLVTFDTPGELRVHVLVDELFRSTTGCMKCNLCSVDCILPSVLSAHWKEKHVEERSQPYRCAECDIGFVSFREFVDHRRKPSEKHVSTCEKLEFKCDACGHQSPDEASYKNHARTVHSVSAPFRCRSCSKSFSRLFQLEKHFLSVEFDPNRVCDRCGVRCKYAPDLSRHISVDHNITDMRICDECGESFGSKNKLDWHKQFSHRVMFCPACNERFPNGREQDVVLHLYAAHGGFNTFPCDTCGDSFMSAANLRRHVSDAHVKQFKCDECGKTFCSSTTLTKHHEMQHGGAVCPMCGVVLKNRFHIKRHIRTVHEKKKEEKCQFCGEGFAYTHGLYRHQAQVHNYRVDRMQRPCAECGKIFKTNSQLTKHRLGVHGVAPEGIKVYPCTRCDRKFTDARQLKEHTYSHEGIKPHQCPKCDHRTVTFVNLKTHMKWKHKRIVSRKLKDGVVGDDLAYDIVDEGPWNREEEEKPSGPRRSGKSVRDVPVRSLDQHEGQSELVHEGEGSQNPPSAGSSFSG